MATEKARIVAESLDPEVNTSEVARRNGVSRGLLNVWRRRARELAEKEKRLPAFASVQVESEARFSGAVTERLNRLQ